MIDYILKFSSENAAKTALASRLGKDDNNNTVWPLDYCFPGISLWLDSQDTVTTDADGNETSRVHNYLPGYYILVSLPNVLPALRDSNPVQVVIDRDLAKARQPGAVIKSNVSNAVLMDVRWSPVCAGSDNPWGTWQ